MGCSLHAAFNVLLICLAYAPIQLTHSNTIALCTRSLTCPTWKLRYWNMLNVSPSSLCEKISHLLMDLSGASRLVILDPQQLNDFYYYDSISLYSNQSYELGNISKPWIKSKGGLEDIFSNFHVRYKISIKRGRDEVLGSKSALPWRKRNGANIWKESCEINEQRKCQANNKRTCNHTESSIFSSHLIRELTIIIQLTAGDPITSI